MLLKKKAINGLPLPFVNWQNTMSEMLSGNQNEIRMENNFTPHPGPLLVRRGEGEEFLGDVFLG
jgi:hypothetical protein